MASEIAFSGPGAPDLGVDNDAPDTTLPTFFDRKGNEAIEGPVSMQEYETAKEKAMRLDAIAGTGDGAAEQTAPRV